MPDGNKRDMHCVLVSLLDAALAQIVDDLPFIKLDVPQSDNARCYENHFVLVEICILNNPDIFISSFVHTKTQDGKIVLDAHLMGSVLHRNHMVVCQIEKNLILQTDLNTNSVTPDNLTMEEIQASLKGDKYFNCEEPIVDYGSLPKISSSILTAILIKQ